MPGLTGIFHAPSPDPALSSSLDRMTQRMVHEPFHASDTYTNPEHRIHLGWVWDTAMPAHAGLRWNDRKDLGLLFTGEDVSGTLETLLSRYERVGIPALADLNGCFAGVLIDLRAGKQILFNDRFGLSRISWHQGPTGVHVASEAKSLLAVLPQLRSVDPRGLAEFYSVGCVLQDRSLFTDVSLLPGASAWTFHRDGRLEKSRYFDPKEWEEQRPLDVATYTDRLTETFSRILPRYLRSPDQLALSMTGGLDSRMVLAWAQPKPGTLPCYTFGGTYRDCADLTLARKLAHATGQRHTTLPIGSTFLAEFAALAEKTVYLSDGTMDVSGAVELFANRQARPLAPIRLTGNYGSEILRSNVAFRPAKLDLKWFTPEFARLIDLAKETYQTEAAGNRLSLISFKQVPWHHYARRSIEMSQLTPRSPFLDNDLVALAYQAPPELATSAQPILNLIQRGNPTLAAVPSDRALRSKPSALLDPLAHAWQEFTAKAEYAYDYGMPPWLARADHAVSALHLERLFLGRHKFYHFRVWYRDALRNAVRTLALEQGQSPSCYRDGSVKQLVEDHTSGRANHTLELHKLLTVQLTERLLVQAS